MTRTQRAPVITMGFESKGGVSPGALEFGMCRLCLRIRVLERHCVAEWAFLYRSVDDATDADAKARCFDTETARVLL